ncbi:hypothetical protein B0H14DRAFT_2642148 [Mycena olivaceomarginata]|nr:hypothetical protein B0H14DRAFT_2642148 [Mycena olivaceomarginata]
MLRRTSFERPPPAPLITTRCWPTGDAPPAQVEARAESGGALGMNEPQLLAEDVEFVSLVVVEESEPHERIVPPSRKMDSTGRNPLDMAALERLSIQREGQERRVNLASVIITEFERFVCGRIEVVKHDKALGRNVQEHEPVVEYGGLSKRLRLGEGYLREQPEWGEQTTPQSEEQDAWLLDIRPQIRGALKKCPYQQKRAPRVSGRGKEN